MYWWMVAALGAVFVGTLLAVLFAYRAWNTRKRKRLEKFLEEQERERESREALRRLNERSKNKFEE